MNGTAGVAGLHARHLVAGVDSEAQLRMLNQTLGLPEQDLHVLVNGVNPIAGSTRFAGRVVLVRQGGESRSAQLRRLLATARRFGGSTYFWREQRGALRNLASLGFMCLAGGVHSGVFHRGVRLPVTRFVAQWLNPVRLLQWAASALATLLLESWYLVLGLAGPALASLRATAIWLRPAACPVSLPVLQEFTASAARRFLLLDDDLRRPSRYRRLRALALIGIWGPLSGLFAIVFWPWSLLQRLLVPPWRGRRRILFISHEARMNGAPVSLLTLLRGLDREEFEPYLLCPTEGMLTLAAREAGIPVLILPVSQLLTQHPSPRSIAIALCRMGICMPYLLLLLAQLRIHTVHTNVMVTPDGALAATVTGVTSLWHFRECIEGGPWSRLQALAMNTFSHRILCNSDYSRQVLNARGIHWMKMITVHNALDMAAFQAAPDPRLRRALGAGDGDLLIGCVGQITPVKGQETFVQAALELLPRYPNLRFVLVGTLDNSTYVRSLQALMEARGMTHRFNFTGFRSDVADIMGALDVHVTPSNWQEPFGRVALEAMAGGAVSVVSRAGGLPEVVEDGVSGLHFPVGDWHSLAAQLETLIVDPALRESLSRAGRRRAATHFSSQRQVDSIQQIYRYPLADANRWPHSRTWCRLRRFLPGRMRAHPKLLVWYALLVPAAIALWAVSLPIFLACLPFAMILGRARRRARNLPAAAVLAYQPRRNAATRYRVTALAERCDPRRLTVDVFYPSSERLADRVYVAMFYGDAPHAKDTYYYLWVFPVRLWSILRTYGYHVAVIQYELFYEGPLWMERLLAATHPHAVYDFDDSLYIFPRFQHALPGLLGAVKGVIAGNSLLAGYAARFNPRVVVIPTCPDPAIFPAAQPPVAPGTEERAEVIIGWMGNPANLFYLEMLGPALARLSAEHPVRLVVICAGPYDLANYRLADLPVTRKEWSLATEGRDIAAFDIGVMPVVDDEVGRGKCGFKALQFMAAGLPCVISPVGINADIVEDGVTGFLARNDDDWYRHLLTLVQDPGLRREMGARARRAVQERFDIGKWAEVWQAWLVDGAADS